MSTPLDDAGALARFEQAAIVGTGPCGAEQLTQLAWLAARARFGRIAAPALAEAPLWPDDPRALLPDAVRRPLIALLTGKEARVDGPMARQIARELRRHGLRPHPYDLKVLEEFVARQAANLGRHAQAWLALVRPVREEGRDLYDDDADAVSAESFATAGRAQKLAFLRALRTSDPERARAVIEQHLGQEPAIVRTGMVAVLEIGLVPEDAGVLERLVVDRAPSVREAASAMLARVPGTEAYARRQAEATSWLELAGSPLDPRQPALRVKARANLPPERLEPMLRAAFDGLGLADMAQPFAMTIEAFARAAGSDWRIARLVLARAVQEDRPDIAALMTREAGDDEAAGLLAAITPALALLAPARREAFVAATLHPERWSALPSRLALEALRDALDGPLPAATIETLLASAIWAKTIGLWEQGEDRTAVDTLEAIAALVPATAAPAFLRTIEPLPAASTRRPRLYHACLQKLVSR